MRYASKFIELVHSVGFKSAVVKSTIIFRDVISILVLYALSLMNSNFDVKNSVRFGDFRLAFSCDINQLLPRSTTLGHPLGIVIARNAKIGENVTIYQNVTVGTNIGSTKLPTIGDNVTIYSGASIIGDVNVGNGAVIASNSVVVDDVEANSTVAGAPAVEVAQKD